MAGAGEMLRLARESHGLPLEVVAAETRIRIEYLEAIEQDDYAALPGDVYTRGFLRNYANHLGLDPEAVLAAYEGRSDLPRKRARAAAAAPAAQPHPREPIRIQPLSPTRINTRVRYAPSLRLMGLVAFVLLIAVYLGYSAYTSAGRQSAIPTPTLQAQVTPPTGAPTIVGAAQAEHTFLATPSPRSLPTQPIVGQAPPADTPIRGSSTVTPIMGQPVNTQTPIIGQLLPQDTPFGGQPLDTPTPVLLFGVGTPLVDAAATLTAGATPAAGVNVQLSVGSQNAWVLVSTDGKVQFQGTLAAGSVRAFSALNTVRVRFARGDITSVNVNGVDKGLASDSSQTVITKEWDAFGGERVIAGP